MADNRAQERGLAPRGMNTVGAHRANDLIFGHVGRISYLPFENEGEDIGHLSFNRVINPTPFLQEVELLKWWYQATKKTALAQIEDTAAGPSRKRQKTWLLKKLPEAFLGNTALDAMLDEGAKIARTPRLASSGVSTLPLLSHGEITDATLSRPSSCPALAMATGKAGHILRVAKLSYRSWKWTVREQVSLQLGVAGSTREGHWCGAKVPLTQIKFASHDKLQRKGQWLLVQTPTSTTLLAPQLGKDSQVDQTSCCDYVAEGPLQISMNPILTLGIGQTGGNPHADVALSPESGHRSPLLAIIDQAGNWSVWKVEKKGSRRDRVINPTLRMCGNIIHGPMETLPEFGAPSAESYKVLWLQSQENPDSQSSPRTIDEPFGGSRASMDPARRRDESRLLLCDRTMLRVFDFESGLPVLAVNLARNIKTDMIRDIQRCPIDPLRVFALTTTTIFWLRIPSPSEDNPRSDSVSGLTILMSCSHLRDQRDETLRLGIITSAVSGQDRYSRLVSIYSANSPQITLFWFSQPETGGLARSHHQVFRFKQSADSKGDNVHLQTLLAIPRSYVYDCEAPTGDPGLAYVREGVRFFQIIALAEDLRVCSWLCATTERHGGEIVAPLIRGGVSRLDKRRKAVIRQFSNSFVVPDDFDERTILRQPTLPGQLGRLDGRVMKEVRPKFIDLSHVFKLLSERTAKSIHNARGNRGVASRNQALVSIRGAIETGIENGHLPLTSLLSLAGNSSFIIPDDAIGIQWAGLLGGLRQGGAARLVEWDLSRESSIKTPSQMYQILFNMWSAHLPEGLLTEQEGDDRNTLLAVIAAQLFLSQIGVELTPANLLPQDSSGLDDMATEPVHVSGLPTPADAAAAAAAASSPVQTKAEPMSSQEWIQEQTPEETQEEEEEDPAITRLRQYAVHIKSSPKPKTQSRLLSHWEVGADPSEYTWSMEGASASEAEREATRKQGRQQALRRRRAERLGLEIKAEAGEHEAEIQPGRRIIHSSQMQGESQPSQQSQASGPSRSMSQPLGGPHGGRRQAGGGDKKKVKKTGGFK